MAVFFCYDNTEYCSCCLFYHQRIVFAQLFHLTEYWSATSSYSGEVFMIGWSPSYLKSSLHAFYMTCQFPDSCAWRYPNSSSKEKIDKSLDSSIVPTTWSNSACNIFSIPNCHSKKGIFKSQTVPSVAWLQLLL